MKAFTQNFKNSTQIRRCLEGLRVWLLVLSGLTLCTDTFAQTSQSLTGLVTDSAGAAVAKAKVTVHNEATGVDKIAVTTSTGNWTVPFLNPGIYDVRVEAENFQSVNQVDITLETGQTATVNFALNPGRVSETVVVNASEKVLDYEKADRGMLIENKSMEELPVTTGNSFNLALLSPGVMTTTAGAPYNQSAQSLSIHNAGVEFNIDGVTNASMTGPEHYTYAPPVAAVQEFKITTNPLDAAIGRSPGGQIDMTLKTGTQKLHGTAYEYLMRAFLNANSSTNDANIANALAAGKSTKPYNKAASTGNQWGFELDGPVIIPKLMSGNRRTFFTIMFEDLGNHGVGTSTATVPTPEMMGKGSKYPGQGDFSGLLGLTQPGGASYNEAIYDPMSEAACTANNTDNGTYAKGNPHVCRYQFGFGPGPRPGPQGNPVQVGPINVIPASRINPVALAILSWYPSPNQSPTFSTSNPFGSNYVGNPPGNRDNKTYLIKLDVNYGDNDSFDITGKLWKTYGQANSALPRSNVNSDHPGINETVNIAHYNGTDYRYPSLSTSWTHIFSPSIVNVIRGLVTTALESDATGPDNGYNPANLGFPSAMASVSSYFNRFPYVKIANYTVLGSQTGLYRGDDMLQLSDTVNWTRGNHTTHFGGEVRFTQYSQKSSNGNGITLNTSNAWSQQWDTNVTGTINSISSNVGYTNNYSGNSIASMMLGTWDNGPSTSPSVATAAAGSYFSSHYAAAYFQDDWKVRPNLTLNLGVRWEDPGIGLVDRYDRLNSVFDNTDINPITSLVSPATLASLGFSGGFLGGPTWAGVGGNPRSEYHHVLWQFGPRAGFAYTVNQKTVVRGGIGLFFNDQANGNQFQPGQLGFSTSTSYNSSTVSSIGGLTPANNLANPFPTFQSATGNCGGNKVACLVTNAGQGLSYENPNYHPAELLQVSFGVERQLTGKDTVEISFASTRGYDNTVSDDINHVSASAQAACDPLRGGNGKNCTQAYGSTPSPGTTVGYISNPFYQLTPFAASGAYYTNTTIQKINFTRPYPVFQSITANRLNGGKSWYNAGEVIYDHRTSLGLTMHVGYGYSKALGSGGYVDTINRVPARGISSTDAPHRLTVSGVYQLPIGRGRALFSRMPRYADLVAGGWQVGSIYLYQSGFPQDMSGWIIDQKANGGYLLPKKRYWSGNSNPWFPNYQSAGQNSYVQRMKPCVASTDPNTGDIIWYGQSQALVNQGLCSTPNFIKVGTYGVTPNIVYSGIREGVNNNFDMNLSKNFTITEGKTFQLRIDAFNALNHIQLSNTKFSTSDGTFGQYVLGTAGNGSACCRTIQIIGRLTW